MEIPRAREQFLTEKAVYENILASKSNEMIKWKCNDVFEPS